MVSRSSTVLNLLLVEDSPSDAALLQGLLSEVEGVSFNVSHVKSLAAAQVEVSEQAYDAVILDLGLPDSLGLITYDKLRSSCTNNRLPILIVSGNDDRDTLTDALERGADNYLIKETFDGNRVAVAILSAIRNRSTRGN